jgi:hypothetical protein
MCKRILRTIAATIALLLAFFAQANSQGNPVLFTVKGNVGTPLLVHLYLRDTLTKQYVDSTFTNMGAFSMTFSEEPRNQMTWILSNISNGHDGDCCFIRDTFSIPSNSIMGGTDTITITPYHVCCLSSKDPVINVASPVFTMQALQATKTVEAQYILPTSSQVHMALYDIDGRMIKTFFNRHESAGKHAAGLTISGLPAGIYFLKLQTDTRVAIVRMSFQR